MNPTANKSYKSALEKRRSTTEMVVDVWQEDRFNNQQKTKFLDAINEAVSQNALGRDVAGDINFLVDILGSGRAS
jgi:hypothetical protein